MNKTTHTLTVTLADVVEAGGVSAAIGKACDEVGLLHDFGDERTCTEIVEEVAMSDGILPRWIVETQEGKAAQPDGQVLWSAEDDPDEPGNVLTCVEDVQLDSLNWTAETVVRCVCPSLADALRHPAETQELMELAWHSPHSDQAAWELLDELIAQDMELKGKAGAA